MSTEISEEAKLAIANGHLFRARQRLVRDGCQTNAAMQRRLLALAAERDLPPAEYAKLMHKRVLFPSIQRFCKKHDVSLDWLMDGDLKGLQRMKAWKKQGRVMDADELKGELYRIAQLFCRSRHRSKKSHSIISTSWQQGATPMRSPKATKAAKTRARNARARAIKAKARAEVELAEKTLLEARSKAYHQMEPYVCDLSYAATLAMEVSDLPELFLFAVNQLDDMIERFKANYYAKQFWPE